MVKDLLCSEKYTAVESTCVVLMSCWYLERLEKGLERLEKGSCLFNRGKFLSTVVDRGREQDCKARKSTLSWCCLWCEFDLY